MVTSLQVQATIFLARAVTTYRYSNSLFHVTSLQSIRRSKESSFLACVMTLKVKPGNVSTLKSKLSACY